MGKKVVGIFLTSGNSWLLAVPVEMLISSGQTEQAVKIQGHNT
jgi:hypothetical protein